MKNSSKTRTAVADREWRTEGGLTIGMDLGDKESSVCVLGADGEIRHQDRVRTTEPALQAAFSRVEPSLIVIEVGTHSPWVSRLLRALGHKVIVANPRRLKLISQSDSKSDRVDALMLAELGRAMPRLLNPVQHRSAEAQADLAMVRARTRMVEARTKLWNSLRGIAKSMGPRLPRKVKREHLGCYGDRLDPLWEAVQKLSDGIQEYDELLEKLEEKYPAVQRLKKITGVGTIIALTFVLTLDDATRFHKSRQVGSYLGLRPQQRDSGQRQPQLPITKTGDRYLRSLLIQGAQYILGKFGPDTDLRRWGLSLASRGGKAAKKRAVVAVARKLAVLMHRLWVSEQEYQPLRMGLA
jgi:transposase